MQTVEQRIAMLDKRIEMFGNYLQTQIIALNIKYKKCGLMEKLSYLHAMDVNLKQFLIIASKPTSICFPKGGAY